MPLAQLEPAQLGPTPCDWQSALRGYRLHAIPSLSWCADPWCKAVRPLRQGPHTPVDKLRTCLRASATGDSETACGGDTRGRDALRYKVAPPRPFGPGGADALDPPFAKRRLMLEEQPCRSIRSNLHRKPAQIRVRELQATRDEPLGCLGRAAHAVGPSHVRPPNTGPSYTERRRMRQVFFDTCHSHP